LTIMRGTKRSKIKKNDQVAIIAGRDKGKRGRVLEVAPARGKVKVEAAGMIKRHQKANPSSNRGGGIIEKEAPLWASKVMPVDPKTKKPTRVKIKIDENGQKMRVAKSGARDPSYNEAEVSEAMKSPKIQIKVSLGLGKGRDRVLTCDLTKEYVAINGDYRS